MVVNIHDLEFGDRALGVTPNCKKQKINKYTHTQIETHIYNYIQHISSQLKVLFIKRFRMGKLLANHILNIILVNTHIS